MTILQRAAVALPTLVLAVSVPLLAREKSEVQPTMPVTVKNFQRAESDTYFAKTVKNGAFGKFHHDRAAVSIDKQDIVRMNRDTLYSSAVFDLDAGSVTITLPESGGRFMSLLVISEDHYAPPVVYAPGSYTFDKSGIGTRYMMVAIRTFANPGDTGDIKAANALQDKIQVRQARIGTFEVPNWDPVTLGKVREHLAALESLGGCAGAVRMGAKEEVDAVCHLLVTATGWGLNPPSAAVYNSVYPKANDGKTVHKLTVKDVPVDGFWSISVYNASGYFEKNALNAYSINNVSARPNPDGSVTIQFGGCSKDTPNCLVAPAGWNYAARLYRPRKEVLDGTWKFPEALPSM